jgi:hypothetical protein
MSKLNAALRSATWNQYVGVSEGTSLCYCCGLEPISKANFACGHVIARAKGGKDTLPNLRPVCTLCNSSMGTNNMKDFAATNGLKGKILTEVPPEPPSSEVVVGLPLPEEKTHYSSEKGECAMCKKSFSHATLAKYDGLHCYRCFKIMYSAPQKIILKKADPSDTTSPCCGHCGGRNIVIAE